MRRRCHQTASFGARTRSRYVRITKAVPGKDLQGTDAVPRRDRMQTRTAPKREPGSETWQIQEPPKHTRGHNAATLPELLNSKAGLGKKAKPYTPREYSPDLPSHSNSTAGSITQQRLRTTREAGRWKLRWRPARRRSHRKRNSWKCSATG